MSTSQRPLALLSLSFAAVGFLSLLGGVALAVFGFVGGAAAFVAGSGLGAVGSAAGITTMAVVSGAVLALTGLPELCAWWGISQRKPWGRTLGIVLCTMSLAAFPIGTAFGAWGLSVLLHSEGVAAFGAKRSFVGDGIALVVGWMLMSPSSVFGSDGSDHRHDHRHDRFDRRDRYRDRYGRRRYRARRSGGIGCFGLILMLMALGMLFSCGSVLTNCAGVVASGSSSSGAPPLVEGTPFENGPGSVTGRALGEYLRSVTGTGALDAGDGTNGGAPVPITPAPIAPAPVAPAPNLSAPDASAIAPAPSVIASPAETKPAKGIWIFKDKNGQSHIVDDYEKIPEPYRPTARDGTK